MKKYRLLIFILFPLFTFAQKQTIRVTNADQFVKAIGSDRTIILSADTFRLRDIVQLKNVPLDTEGFPDMKITDHVTYSAGWGIGIIGVSNLTIIGDTLSKIHSLFSTSDEGDEILTFSECYGISLQHIDAVHLLPVQGPCNGGVLFFNDCKNISISNSRLRGCGTCGILCDGDTNLVCTKCVIEECSSLLFELNKNQHLLFQNCTFTKIKVSSSLIYLTDCVDVHFVQCDFTGNFSDEEGGYYNADRNFVFHFYDDKTSKDILVDNCTFSDNKIIAMTNKNNLLVRNNVKYVSNDNLRK